VIYAFYCTYRFLRGVAMSLSSTWFHFMYLSCCWWAGTQTESLLVSTAKCIIVLVWYRWMNHLKMSFQFRCLNFNNLSNSGCKLPTVTDSCEKYSLGVSNFLVCYQKLWSQSEWRELFSSHHVLWLSRTHDLSSLWQTHGVLNAA